MTKGRYREFYQCDIDIATDPRSGTEPMLPDAECVKIVSEILSGLKLGRFAVKVNHRKLLDGMFAACGVEPAKFRAICSAVDKLDKLPWADVRCEMVETKGLAPEVADRIGAYVADETSRGSAHLPEGERAAANRALVARLREDAALNGAKGATKGLDDMAAFLSFCDAMGCGGSVSFDLSLARGLDYYTGVIYEAVLLDADVGSVAGGGRYDNLVGMFTKKNKTIPCVGISIGIERLFAIVERRAAAAAKAAKKAAKEAAKAGGGGGAAASAGGAAGAAGLPSALTFRASPTEVFVASAAQKGKLFDERLRLCAELWAAGVKTEMKQKRKVKLLNQFQKAEADGIPLCVILGEDEIARGVVQLKDFRTADRSQEEVPREGLAAAIRAKLAQ